MAAVLHYNDIKSCLQGGTTKAGLAAVTSFINSLLQSGYAVITMDSSKTVNSCRQYLKQFQEFLDEATPEAKEKKTAIPNDGSVTGLVSMPEADQELFHLRLRGPPTTDPVALAGGELCFTEMQSVAETLLQAISFTIGLHSHTLHTTLIQSKPFPPDTASASVLTAMRFKAKGGGETEPSPAKRRSSIGIGLKDDIPDSETFQDQGLLSLTLTNQNGLKVRHHSAGWLEPCIASGVRQQHPKVIVVAGKMLSKICGIFKPPKQALVQPGSTDRFSVTFKLFADPKAVVDVWSLSRGLVHPPSMQDRKVVLISDLMKDLGTPLPALNTHAATLRAAAPPPAEEENNVAESKTAEREPAEEKKSQS